MAAKSARTKAQPDTTAELASFFAKYEPAIAKLGNALRAKLRQRLPGLFELVYFYERQGSLVIAYSPTERGAEGLCSIAVDASGVKLYFGRGAELAKADPNQLLQGRAKQVRYVELRSAAELDRPEIEGLIVAALELAQLRLDKSSAGATISKAEEQKKRGARRPKGARPKAARVKAPRGAKKARS
ncbi:MAG: DUF1801 domain-containing protein [Planctomycetes bacterium]|nr:DUF1801 domain-containing protein [Planctomycetota bacterium]